MAPYTEENVDSYLSSDDEAMWEESSVFLDQNEWETYMLDDSRFLWESLQAYISDYNLPLLENCAFETFVDFLFKHSSKRVV